MPVDEGQAFVESLEGVEAVWLCNDGTIYTQADLLKERISISMSRKLLNRSDWVVLGTILIGALVLYGLFHFLFSQSSSQVSVYYDDRLVATLDLNQDETLVLSKADYPLLLDDLEITVLMARLRLPKRPHPTTSVPDRHRLPLR